MAVPYWHCLPSSFKNCLSAELCICFLLTNLPLLPNNTAHRTRHTGEIYRCIPQALAAAESTHWLCSYLSNSTDTWECNAYASMSTSKMLIACTARLRPGKAWQRVPRAALPSLSGQGTMEADPVLELEVSPADLPASPCSLQCQLRAGCSLLY